MHPLRTVLRWIGRHVRGFHAALGAYLLLGLGASVAALLAFAAVANLVARDATRRVDERVLLWLNRRSSPALDEWAETITQLGASATVVMVVVVATALLWAGRHRYSALLLWVAMLGGAVLNYTLKEAFARPRPELWERMEAGNPSFPSGHAQSAVVIYGTLAYLIARLEPSRRLRRLTLGVAAVVILLIGVTRLYLGVHYPSDVLAGYVAGLAWATLCALGIEAIRYFRARKPEVALQEEELDRRL